MWNVGEYRKRPKRLSDYLPWAALIGPGVVLNKDGNLPVPPAGAAVQRLKELAGLGGGVAPDVSSAVGQVRSELDGSTYAPLEAAAQLNRTVQNRVVQDLEPTAQRVQDYVEKSNSAPGMTAAVQSDNEELATVVAQVQALQAMEVTDARGDTEREAQEQAEEAYGREQRAKVRGEWKGQSAPSTTPVPNPFSRAGE